ncbi:MAG TPA: biotin--[acetyl-CoA-carboxylase] ligase [Gemmatimonadaceae bacterium]|nr:biotin--[acetyl-CoA-carboxylase] ligase [Gemmatimonadaceae bacterium]
MSSSADTSVRYDGRSAAELEALLGGPCVALHASVTSTLDEAHAMASSAPPGTLVLADEQTAGRGTHGRRWASPRGAGVWLALIERPGDASALDVLSLRCGLYAAEALDALADARIGVKWPNDLQLGGRKLAGVLIETRWRGGSAEWVAIGFGLNVLPPTLATAAGLPAGRTRIEALTLLVPALRRAAAARGHLTDDELARWASRDVARGRTAAAPTSGVVEGITASGALVVRTQDGSIARFRTGSLTFAEALACS